MLASIILLWSVLTVADTPAYAESFSLSQCAVVQLGAAPRLFIALPSNELAGIDVRTGRLLWRTAKAAFPLLARGNRILALLPPVAGKPGWLFGVLDARSGAVLARFPPWGQGSGTVGEGMGTSMGLEGVSQGGHDYVAWRSRSQPMSGVPGNYPIYVDSGAAQVDLTRATLIPTPKRIPSRYLAVHVDHPAGYHTDLFAVDDITAVAARKYVNPGFQLLLRRWRGGNALPDVVVLGSAQNSDAISVSADRRNVLGIVQDPAATPRFHYNIVVFSTITGRLVGRLVSELYPAGFVVWGHRLIYFFPDRVAIGDLATAQPLYQWALRDLNYRGPYPPAVRRP
jgi:hypothetical protein